MKKVGASKGLDTYVAVPRFPLDIAEPLYIDKLFKQSIEQLRKEGFTGDEIFIGGHSLGGVNAQNYAKKDKGQVIKGVALMGSTLLTDVRKFDQNGKSSWDMGMPVLQITGTKDGLFRITRQAETVWSQEYNIVDEQRG